MINYKINGEIYPFTGKNIVKGGDIMNKLLYCCYSPRLKEFLLKNNCKYEICAKNPNNDKTFWIYIRNDKLDKLLNEWSNNKNN